SHARPRHWSRLGSGRPIAHRRSVCDSSPRSRCGGDCRRIAVLRSVRRAPQKLKTRFLSMSTNQKPAIRTPLQNWHMEHGAHLVARNGWKLPAHYGSPQSELAAAREGIGLADISACAKLRLDGNGVRGFASEFVPASLSKPGEVAIID